jgi:hypothetical protein
LDKVICWHGVWGCLSMWQQGRQVATPKATAPSGWATAPSGCHTHQ